MDSEGNEAQFLCRWSRLADHLEFSPDASAGVAMWLLQSYSAADRHYHGIAHILAMLADFDRFQTEFNQPLVVQLAIFFHDAIYDASRSDNEIRSAEELRIRLGSGLEADIIGKACFIIEATKAHAATGDADADLVIDLDMAVLARDWPDYLRYARDVMKEYVPIYGEAAYREGRIARFLQPAIASGIVFLTHHFQTLTAKGLANMQRESELMASGASFDQEGGD